MHILIIVTLVLIGVIIVLSRKKPVSAIQTNMNLPYKIGYSVGTVSYDPERHYQIDDLLMEADAAMYREKKASKATSSD